MQQKFDGDFMLKTFLIYGYSRRNEKFPQIILRYTNINNRGEFLSQFFAYRGRNKVHMSKTYYLVSGGAIQVYLEANFVNFDLG